MPDLDPYAKLDRMNADNVSPGSAVGDAVLDPRALEVARLAGLPSLDYQAERVRYCFGAGCPGATGEMTGTVLRAGGGL